VGAAVFIATVAAGVHVCRGDRLADAFCSLMQPSAQKAWSTNASSWPWEFPLLVSVHRQRSVF